MSSATPPSSAGGGADRIWWRRGAIVAVALALLAHAPALANGFVWDDRQLIFDNPTRQADHPVVEAFRRDFFGGGLGDRPSSNYYRPLVTLTYLADHALGGDSPFGYHLTNLLLHAAATLALLLAARRFGASPRVAAAAAILFAIHPIHLESVAWIAGRTDTLCAALLLFALATRGPASWLLGAAALLSKETALIWPALAALRDRAPGSAGDRRCAWRARIPELLIVAAVLAARHAVLASFAGSFGFDLAESAVGALHLIGLFAGPWLAAQVYVIPLSIPPLLPGAAVGLALVAAAVVAARRRPATRPWLAAAAISLAPGVAALATAHILGPRLLYLPSAFLCLWVAELLVPALTRVRSRSRRLAAVVAGATVLVATTAWGALRWRDDLTFWRHAAAGAPRPDVLAKLALLEHDSGDLAAAWRTLERPGRLPQTHYLRALILSEIGCPDRAVAEYRQALALQPDYPAAAINLRALTSRHGEAPPPCAVDVPTALADPETLNAAALARAREGEGRQAHALIDAALRLRPDWPEALYTRAQLHYLAKDFPAAVTTAESLLQIDPAFTRAYKVLGLSQAKLGQRAAAHDSLTRYLSAHPTAPDAAELRAIIDQLESEP